MALMRAVSSAEGRLTCRTAGGRPAALSSPQGAAAGARRDVQCTRYGWGASLRGEVSSKAASESNIGEMLTGEDPCSDAVSSWDELDSMSSLAYAVSAGAGDFEGIARITAAEDISPMSTYEILQPVGAVERYSQAFDGTLFNCTTVIDMHYRLLKDCMIQDTYSLVNDTYSALEKTDPPLGEDLIAATATVGAQALEYLKEEHEIVTGMLEEMVADSVDEEMRRDYFQAKAVVDAVDNVIAELPLYMPSVAK